MFGRYLGYVFWGHRSQQISWRWKMKREIYLFTERGVLSNRVLGYSEWGNQVTVAADWINRKEKRKEKCSSRWNRQVGNSAARAWPRSTARDQLGNVVRARQSPSSTGEKAEGGLLHKEKTTQNEQRHWARTSPNMALHFVAQKKLINIINSSWHSCTPVLFLWCITTVQRPFLNLAPTTLHYLTKSISKLSTNNL